MGVPRDVFTPFLRISSLGSIATIDRNPRAARMRVQMPVPAPMSAASTLAASRPAKPRIAVATCGA
jgi:hypothetical protein